MTVLVVAAHPDDEVLGCGGTICWHVAAGETVNILFISDGVKSRSEKSDEADVGERRAAGIKAAEIMGVTKPHFSDYPDNQLDTVPLLNVVQTIESVLQDIKPDTVYTHHSGDLNIDHALVNRAVMTACRPTPKSFIRNIYAFEIPSSTEWAEPTRSNAFVPTYFVDISSYLDTKLNALAAYTMEVRDFPHPRSHEAVSVLSKWRGASVGFRAAEAFQVIRQIKP